MIEGLFEVAEEEDPNGLVAFQAISTQGDGRLPAPGRPIAPSQIGDGQQRLPRVSGTIIQGSSRMLKNVLYLVASQDASNCV